MQARTRSQSKGFIAWVKRAGRPTPQQAGLIALLVVVVVLTGWSALGFAGQLVEVREKRAELEVKRAELEARHKDLEAQARFVSDPDYLEQELRTRFNFKLPNEKMIIVVPPQETTENE